MNITQKPFVLGQSHSLTLLALLCLFALSSYSPAVLSQTPPQGSWRQAIATLTPDARLVIGAIVNRMRARDLSNDIKKDINFADNLTGSLQEKSFHYTDFTLTSVAVNEYHFLETDPQLRWVSAILRFRDYQNRVTNTAVRAEYRMLDEKIVIESVILMPLYSHNPRVDLYYVPSSQLPRNVHEEYTKHGELLTLVREKAVSLNKVELASHEGESYKIFAFLVDRVAPDAAVNLRISDTKNGQEGDYSGTKVLNSDGWFVALGSGKFSASRPEELFYKVIYTPGSNVPKKEQVPKLIGLFAAE